MKPLVVCLATAMMLGAVRAHAETMDLSGVTATATLMQASESSDRSRMQITVENRSTAKFDETRWSCTLLNGARSVGEETVWVEGIRANQQAVKSQALQYAGGAVDGIKCTLVTVRIGNSLYYPER